MALSELDNIWDGTEAEPMRKFLTPGMYRGIVKDYKLAQVGQKKTWCLVVKINVSRPPENAGIEVEKNWWITPNTMPYLARDLKALECPINPAEKLSEELQKIPLVNKEVDFKYDYSGTDDKYPQVQFVNLAKNSATAPAGAGHGVTPKTKAENVSPDEIKEDLPF